MEMEYCLVFAGGIIESSGRRNDDCFDGYTFYGLGPHYQCFAFCMFMGWVFKYYSKDRFYELFFNHFQTCFSHNLWTYHSKKDVYTYLSSNVIANLLGLGTLATISGIKAFQKLQEYNPQKERPSREMLTLVIINTAGLCLFPSTLLTIRQQMGSNDIDAFYPYMLLIGISIIVIGLMIQRMIDHE